MADDQQLPASAYAVWPGVEIAAEGADPLDSLADVEKSMGDLDDACLCPEIAEACSARS